MPKGRENLRVRLYFQVFGLLSIVPRCSIFFGTVAGARIDQPVAEANHDVRLRCRMPVKGAEMAEQKTQGKPWEERLNEANARIEAELQRVIHYIDTEVVPEVRKHGSQGLRAAAAQLQKLAEHMDDQQAGKTGKPL